MRIIRVFGHRVRSLLRRRRADQDLQREMQLHLEQLRKEFIAEGMSEQDALLAARKAFGPVEVIGERCRDARRVNFAGEFARDLRQAARRLIKSPSFTIPAVLTLGLGLAGNIALFQLLDTFVLRSLPVQEPERLMMLSRSMSAGFLSKSTDRFEYRLFEQMKEHGKDAAQLTGFLDLEGAPISVDGRHEPARNATLVSNEFFSVLGVQARLGRLFEAGDDRAGVAVIGSAFWRERFGSDPGVLGRAIQVSGRTKVVIGVAPAGFKGLSPDRPTDVWTPVEPSQASVRIIARLAPGVSAEQASARLEGAAVELSGTAPTDPRMRMRLNLTEAHAGYSRLREQFGKPLVVLMSGVALLLLLACVNLANLLMARAVYRQRELSVCLALGAGRARLMRQMMVESLVLGMAGGVAGVALAGGVVSVIVALLPGEIAPAAARLTVDARVLCFGAGLTLLTTLLFGLGPAWQATRLNVRDGLSDAGRGELGGRGGHRASRVLLAMQVALSIPLLAATGLFTRTLSNLMSVDPGFEVEHLLQAKLDTARAGYSRGKVGPLYRELLSRVSALPGVTAVTGVRNGLLEGGTTSGVMKLPDRGIDAAVFERADVGPRFFATMGIEVVAGRDFSEADTDPTRLVVAVSETFARRYLPGVNPIGQRIGDRNLEIVAVVKDLHFAGLRHVPEPMIYYAALQSEPDRVSALEIRTFADPVAIAAAVRREIDSINPELLVGMKTMAKQREESLMKERLLAFVAAGFGVFALLLVCVGLYGVVARAVGRRTRELGLRKALGASPPGLLLLVVHDTARPVMLGLIAGLIASWAVGRLAASRVSAFLYQVEANDVPTIAATAALLLISTALAALIPATRAARVDPMTALRQD